MNLPARATFFNGLIETDLSANNLTAAGRTYRVCSFSPKIFFLGGGKGHGRPFYVQSRLVELAHYQTMKFFRSTSVNQNS